MRKLRIKKNMSFTLVLRPNTRLMMTQIAKSATQMIYITPVPNGIPTIKNVMTMEMIAIKIPST